MVCIASRKVCLLPSADEKALHRGRLAAVGGRARGTVEQTLDGITDRMQLLSVPAPLAMRLLLDSQVWSSPSWSGPICCSSCRWLASAVLAGRGFSAAGKRKVECAHRGMDGQERRLCRSCEVQYFTQAYCVYTPITSFHACFARFPLTDARLSRSTAGQIARAGRSRRLGHSRPHLVRHVRPCVVVARWR